MLFGENQVIELTAKRLTPRVDCCIVRVPTSARQRGGDVLLEPTLTPVSTKFLLTTTTENVITRQMIYVLTLSEIYISRIPATMTVVLWKWIVMPCTELTYPERYRESSLSPRFSALTVLQSIRPVPRSTWWIVVLKWVEIAKYGNLV